MQQIAFHFSVNEYNLNNFVESTANKAACSVINAWPHGMWGVNPYPKSLILRGPKLSGKTFLAKKWAREARAIFLQPVGDIIENNLLLYQSFVIDDLYQWEEEKLLHYFNIIHEQGKYLLMVTEYMSEIKRADLDSRLKACNIIDIDFPDDHMMQVLIFKLFSDYSIKIDQKVICYLIKRLPRDFSRINHFIARINSVALQYKHKITVPLVKQIMYEEQDLE